LAHNSLNLWSYQLSCRNLFRAEVTLSAISVSDL
jgi:hypothetical protein